VATVLLEKLAATASPDCESPPETSNGPDPDDTKPFTHDMGETPPKAPASKQMATAPIAMNTSGIFRPCVKPGIAPSKLFVIIFFVREKEAAGRDR
jgi:hypothetical protein